VTQQAMTHAQLPAKKRSFTIFRLEGGKVQDETSNDFFSRLFI
jgi:hypothetical protein